MVLFLAWLQRVVEKNDPVRFAMSARMEQLETQLTDIHLTSY